VPRVAGLCLGVANRVGLNARADAATVDIEGVDVIGLGQVDLVVVIQIPPLGTSNVRIVRMNERCHQQERPVVGVAGKIEQLAACGIADLFVVVDLVGGDCLAGLGEWIHVVVPLVDSLIDQRPVGGPGKVGRVDVGGEPFFKAVHLVGANKVHLARQDRAVPGGLQMMRKGRNAGRKLGRVVPSSDG